MTKTGPAPTPNREKLRDFSDFGHSCPAVELDEFRHPSAETDRPSQVVGQRGERELGGDLLLPLAQEAADAVGVLDRAEGMLAGALAELLPRNVAPDEHHDALFGTL